MTTFSIAGSGAGSSSGNDPSKVTQTAGAVDRLWVAVLHERSGLGHSGHALSDDNTGTWTKQGSLDSLLLDGNARHSLSIWTHVTVSADTSSTIISGDAGAGNSRLYLYEISPSAAYDWTFVEAALDTSGTGHWNGQASGNTSSITGSDLFVMGFGAARLDTSPTTATALTQTTNHTDFSGAQHTYFGCAAIDASGQAGGVKSTTLTATGGSDDEGIVGVIVFQDGASGSPFTLTADVQSYALTGNAAGLAADRQLAAAVQSYTLTGTATGLTADRNIAATKQTYTLTGTDTTLTYTPATTDYTLVADVQSYTLTGTATGLPVARQIAPAVAAYALAGTATGLVYNRNLAASVAPYVLTGTATGINLTRGFAADTAAYALTVNATTLTYSGDTNVVYVPAGKGGRGRGQEQPPMYQEAPMAIEGRYEHGQWNVICDRCGFKYKARQLRREWTGLMVCHGPMTTDCWDERHPQDFVKGRPDRQSPPWTRSEADDDFASTLVTPDDL